MAEIKTNILSQSVIDQLWQLTSGSTPTVEAKTLCFYLSGGNMKISSLLRNYYTSTGDHLAALGICYLDHYIGARRQAVSSNSAVCSTSSISDLTKTKCRRKKVDTKLGQHKTGTIPGNYSTTNKVKKPPKKDGISGVKPIEVLPKKVAKTLKAISCTLAGRVVNRSLHDNCAVCDVFKKRAPARGLFKTSQYKAIVKGHDSSLSASVRSKVFEKAFPREKRPTDEMDVDSNQSTGKHNDTSTIPVKACNPSYADIASGKKASKAERKEKRQLDLDQANLKIQVVDEKVKVLRSKLAEGADVQCGELQLDHGAKQILALQKLRRQLHLKKKALTPVGEANSGKRKRSKVS